MPQTQSQLERQSEIPLNPKTEHWRRIFEKYDKDHDGSISLSELQAMIDSREYEHDIPDYVVTKIHEMADKDSNGKLDFEEFVEMINHPDLAPLFGHYVNKYIHLLVPRVHRADITQIDGQYEEEYSCCPPPLGMIMITILEVIFHLIDVHLEPGSTNTASGPVAVVFMYDPHRRREAWRFLTYMFVHVGHFHLIVNMLVQIMLGIPLEMVHRWWRALLVYIAGVAAGSLGTSIFDPNVKLAGASGGVYALMTAHLATIVMNWKEMTYPIVQLFVFLIIIGTDVGTAIYNRYCLDINEHIGYTAHLCGAVAGLLIGLNVLRNLEIRRHEKIIWWCSMVLYFSLMTIAILWNIFGKRYFPPEHYG